MTPLLGFTPDADPMTPGVMTDCVGIVPYETGFANAPTPINAVADPLAGPCQGAAVVTSTTGSRRFFAGTQTHLYELSSTGWDDVSGVAYSGGVDGRWCFAQFGDATLAANGTDPIQRALGGSFGSIAGAPKAKIIFSVGAFVMALNLDDGAVKPDGWANCASFDDTDWTPNVATLANSGRLVSAPGAITAGGRMGEYAVAYKERAIYVGQFIGAPATFDWVQVPGNNAGCVGPDAWCDVMGAHFVVGPDNFWLFDGTRPQIIGEGQVRQWFYNNSNPLYRFRTQCIFDRQNNLVYVHFCSNNSGILDSALVYHTVSKQWGKLNIHIQSALNYVTPNITYDTWDSYGATYNTLTNMSYDSQYWLAGGRVAAMFNGSNVLQTITGAAGTGTFTTGDLGDDDQVTNLKKLRIRFQQNPTSASVITLGKMNQGDALTAKSSRPMTNGQFDVRQSARFHRAMFTLNGNCKFNAIRPTIVPSGGR